MHAAGVLRSFNVSVDPSGTWTAELNVEAAEGFADHSDLAMDLTDVFIAVGEAARERGRGVVLLFDEIQFLSKEQLEAIIQALHKMVQRKLPVTLVGAGLPQIAELAGDAKSYAERLFKFPAIGNLGLYDAQTALTEPALEEEVSFTEEALAEAIKVSEGYPYLVRIHRRRAMLRRSWAEHRRTLGQRGRS